MMINVVTQQILLQASYYIYLQLITVYRASNQVEIKVKLIFFLVKQNFSSIAIEVTIQLPIFILTEKYQLCQYFSISL